MVCIYCGESTRVTNSRRQRKSNSIWRRRTCQSCNATFTTLEALTDHGSIMVRRTQNKPLEPFLRDKLFVSIYESCKHRSSALEDATALTNTVTSKLLPKINEGIITKQDIRQTTHETLKHFNKPAAVHYEAYFFK